MLLPLLVLALCAFAVSVALAILYRTDARHWRIQATMWRTRANTYRRHAVAFRSRP